MRSISNISTFRAFRSTDYTLYLTGRAVSQLGTFMQQTAVVWVIYTITHSAFMLGVATFAEQFPAFLLSIFGGIAADRYSRYRIVNITQITSMIQAILLAVLILTHHYVVWQIMTLSVILGIINAFDVPARQAMIHDVVHDEADLPSALSLSAATASISRFLAPALSGIILEKYGAGICFLINAASFVAIIITLALMKQPKNAKPRNTNKKVFTELAEGIIYIGRTPSIGLVLLVVAIVGLIAMPFSTLLPVFAKIIFKGNAATFGYIVSFISVGSIASTIVLASLKKNASLRKILLGFGVIQGVAMIAFSQIQNFPVAMVVASFIGFGAGAQFTAGNIIVQSETSPRMRGRVISILIMAMFGTLPLGSLMVGAVSQKIGAPATLLSQGILGLIIAILFYYLMMKKNKPAKE
ncbi:MAG: MFS transporter [Chitinophagaceae bacterium]|jgi:MFS family permease|nr:MFS transporter [Chitinophagaceae bacterium]